MSVHATYFDRILEICSLIDDSECHKAGTHCVVEPAQIKKSEEAVQCIIATIKTNPFTTADKNHLYNLPPGAPVSAKVDIDILHAEVAGKGAKDQFIKQQFENGSEISFFDLIKSPKLLMMEACNKVTLTSTQGNVKVD